MKHNKLKLKLLILLLIFSTLFNSCETEVTGVNLPYEETIIVYGLFTDGELSDGLYIAKTVPPLEKPTMENSRVTDAVITIKQNDKIIDLVFDTLLYYKTLEPLIPQQGDILELSIKWKGKEYSSKTYIPKKEKDNEVYFTYILDKNPYGWGYDLNVRLNFVANSNDTYFVGNAQSSNFESDTSLFYHLAMQGSDKFTKNSIISIGGSYIDDTTNFDIYKHLKESDFEMGFLEILDKEFYNYYLSRNNGGDVSNVFGTSGLNVKGNISNNGIGIFIGRNRSFYKIDKITRD